MTAVTPLLWVGDCHFDHVSVGSASEAIASLAEGTTTVVADLETARAVLESLGAPLQTIAERIRDADRRHRSGAID